MGDGYDLWHHKSWSNIQDTPSVMWKLKLPVDFTVKQETSCFQQLKFWNGKLYILIFIYSGIFNVVEGKGTGFYYFTLLYVLWEKNKTYQTLIIIKRASFYTHDKTCLFRIFNYWFTNQGKVQHLGKCAFLLSFGSLIKSTTTTYWAVAFSTSPCLLADWKPILKVHTANCCIRVFGCCAC